MDEVEGLQFDKTGPKSLLSVLRNCYANGVGLRKYSIDAEDMEDVIEIIFKNEEDRTTAYLANTTIQGREIYVHKPLGYRARFLYHLDIYNVPFGDQEETESMLCDSCADFGQVFACNVQVTEDGSWMTGNAYVLLLAYKSHDNKLGCYISHKLFNGKGTLRIKWSKKAVYYPAPN